MGDESSKKAGKRPESATLDRLKSELSAGLKTGEDPLYYDWTRVAAAPPSEAAYVPPMQIHTSAMDTGDLAAIIGRDAAEAARHAPPPEQKVMIDGSGTGADEATDVDFGDALPTEEMDSAPISDDPNAVTRLLPGVGQRNRNGWIWVACAIGAVFGCAAFMWTQRGEDHVEARVPAIAVSTPPIAVIEFPDPPAAPVAPIPAPATSAAKVNAVPVEVPEPAPSRRQPASTRSRLSPAQPMQQKPTGEVVDPLFTEKPGY